MSKRTDSNVYTMIFAIIMVLVVGSLLAFMASSLKPNIDENKRIEKQQNILYAWASTKMKEQVQPLFLQMLLELHFQNTSQNKLKFKEAIKSENSDAYLIDVKKEQTLAKQGKQRRLPLFVGRKRGKYSLCSTHSRKRTLGCHLGLCCYG